MKGTFIHPSIILPGQGLAQAYWGVQAVFAASAPVGTSYLKRQDRRSTRGQEK